MPQYFTNAFHIEKSKFELCGALPSYMKQEDVDYAIYLIIGNIVLVRLVLEAAEPIAEYVKRDLANRMVETEQIRLKT